MKNKLTDLNNHLFAQLERLGEESLKGEKLAEEINRSKAVAGVAGQIISNASLVLEAQKALGDGLIKEVPETMRIEGSAS
jgi:hypothetical protein